jgi:hypothetical protein
VRRADRETVFLLEPESAEALPYSPETWAAGFEGPPEDDAGGPSAPADPADAPREEGEFGALE